MTAAGIAAGALVVLTLAAAARVAAQASARIDIRRNRYDYHEIRLAAEFAALRARKEELDRRLDAVRDAEAAAYGGPCRREPAAGPEASAAAPGPGTGAGEPGGHPDRIERDRDARLAAAERWHRRIQPVDRLLVAAAAATAAAAAACGLAMAAGVL